MFEYIYLSEFNPMMDKVCHGSLLDPSILSGWAGAAAAALMLTAVILAVFYFLASFFQNQPFLAMVKLELYEFFVTFAIFVVLFLLINGMCGVQAGWVYSNPNHTEWDSKSIYYSATNHLMTFADYTLQTMSFQYLAYTFIDYVTSAEISAVPMGIGANMRPTAGLGAAVKPVLNNAFSAETLSTITAEAQAYVLDFGTYGLLKYFLPIALVMRCFLFTRRIGGALIAITCVFLFLYPLLLIPSYAILDEHLQSRLDYVKGVYGAGLVDWSSFLFLFEFMVKWLWGPHLLLAYALMAMPSAATIFIGGVFMPIFNTIILATAARQLSKVLGEEIDITNLTRMI